MKKKWVIAGLPFVGILLFVAFALFQKAGKKSNAPQHQNRPAKVQVKEVTKPKALLKGAKITYWKKVTDAQMRNDLTAEPTPPKPDLSSVPAEVKSLYVKGYVYIQKRHCCMNTCQRLSFL